MLSFRTKVYIADEYIFIPEGYQKLIQLQKMNVIPLVNKLYVNEDTLTEHNLYQKFY